ncbi:MAG: NAD(P)/FAD-dependent oxidoreductase [Promethearchaeota archaeon]|nr:MAG: NAD(P)/FAD-dependent oxidoreductase [Candidatus Lokiarchaeota archaeon]
MTKNDQKFDVIISGAGPSGSKCAEILAKSGFKVALIEKDTTWRKPCGGGVSSRIFKYFPQLRRFNPHRIKSIGMYSADYENLHFSWESMKDDSIVIDRLELDNLIRNVAVDAGAQLFDDHISYDFLIKQGKRVGIKTKTQEKIEEFYGKILIIADGMSSKLAVKSGLRKKWEIDELGLAKCAIMEGETSLDTQSIHVFFRPYKGYGWIFPLSERKFNIGCGTFEEANRKYNLNTIYEEFIRDPRIKHLLPEKTYKQTWSASFPLPAKGVKKNSLFGENIMLIGDTAGFVSPISGEGIHPSIVSGKVAAETAIAALEEENISKKQLKKYKTNSNISKIIRNFQLKRSMVEFFYENDGENLSIMLKLAKQNEKFRDIVVNMFLFNAAPSKEFFSKIKDFKLN